MEEPVDTIRESSRAALVVSRRVQRYEETDVRRHIVNEDVTPALTADIANRLKSKSTINARELRTLKNSILDDPQNIGVVLNTQGAVRGLVRELTGHDARRQLEAAGCLCNLSLGDTRACTALARVAGPYLLTTLHSLHTELAVTCAWALGNAAGGGAGPAALLTSQGALLGLSTLVTSHDDVSDAAAAALLQFVYSMGDELGKEPASHILQAVSQKHFTQSTLQLLSILSCHDDFNQLVDEELFQKLLEHSRTCLDNFTDSRASFMYAIRTLANITINDQVYSVLLGIFTPKLDVLNKLLVVNDDLAKSLLWFLGNLFNYNSEHEFFNVLLS